MVLTLPKLSLIRQTKVLAKPITVDALGFLSPLVRLFIRNLNPLVGLERLSSGDLLLTKVRI
jgi:hypothetical protein